MKDKNELTVEQAVRAIQEEEEDFKAVEEILAMKKEELDSHLENAGFDVATLEERAAAREAEVRRELDAAASPKWWQRWSRQLIALWTVGWMLLTAAATHVIDVLEAPVQQAVKAIAYAPPPDLRKEAFEECGKTHWRACLDKLDEAARADPDGDRNSDVQQARDLAEEKLGLKKK